MPPIITKPNKSFIDSLTIDSGHTMMASYVPQEVGLQSFTENFYKWRVPTKEAITQLGLFGGDINYHTYYPELNLEDLKPKEDEFIEPVFRLLSATIVSKNWNPTDFGYHHEVLKNSMPLLLGQTVNCDHSTDIGNAIGSVSAVAWQEGYKDHGIKIPAGINGTLKIDGKANPRIVRGILMEPPSIHSNSVTVQFAWDKSHPELDDREFWEKLGTYDSKGNLVRRVVTEVVRYHETSLVSHGADPYAQKITQDGKLNNPIFANRTYNSYKEYEGDKNKIYCFTDYKDISSDDTQLINNIEGTPNTQNNIQNNKEMNEELQKFIESLFAEGLLTLGEGKEMTQENAIQGIKELITSSNADKETITNLQTEKDSLTEQVNNLNAQVASLSAMAEVGKNHVISLRENAVNTYKKLMGDDADETIVTMLNAETTGIQTLVSLSKDYQQRLEEKFPLKCKSCGSTDVSRAFSVESNEEDNEDHEELSESSTKAIISKIYKNKLR